MILHLPFPGRVLKIFGLMATIVLGSNSFAAEPELPHNNRSDGFLGIETCGSSTCHGSPEPWRNATILMKERTLWEQFDPHSKAYEALKSQRAKLIASKLNLKNAHEAPECLTCHATYVPEDQRGEGFSLSSGVTCESCHGPGGAFLSTHLKADSNHSKNIAAGLYPTDSPAHRAKLCLSCHQADSNNKFSHRYYGAGHPRLKFELETYTAAHSHFNIDADYIRRKNPPSAVFAWAKGQLVSGLHISESLLTNIRGGGLVPELAHFECSDCHQSIAELTDITRSSQNFGSPSINIANMIMIHAVASVIDVQLARQIRNNITTLIHTTNSRRSVTEALIRLTKQLKKLNRSLESLQTNEVSGLTLANRLISSMKELSSPSYYMAEMTAMSLSTLTVSDYEDKRIDSSELHALEKKLDKVFQNLGTETNYNRGNYLRAVKAFADDIKHEL